VVFAWGAAKGVPACRLWKRRPLLKTSDRKKNRRPTPSRTAWDIYFNYNRMWRGGTPAIRREKGNELISPND